MRPTLFTIYLIISYIAHTKITKMKQSISAYIQSSGKAGIRDQVSCAWYYFHLIDGSMCPFLPLFDNQQTDKQ